MSARETLRREMTHNHPYMTEERADELIDALLVEHAAKLRAAQRDLTVRELSWARGHHQWQCPQCGAGGNVTSLMARSPGPWHRCRPKADGGASPVRPDEDPTP